MPRQNFPESSITFLTAQQLQAERKAAHEEAHPEPVCLCHDGVIDGVAVHFTNAGCQLHAEYRDSRYIRVLQTSRRLVGHRHCGRDEKGMGA